ncbi:SixA phosphatase family protein [Sulfurimonas sp. ST-27]|uniref:SixA phosphatase family protein n=1 Tax=Sulfurimonas sp. ST-27 TaxID=3400152 RepID=UPI003AB26774
MKTLYIIRHAKSSWKNMDLDDFDRPLNKRGRHDAPMMGERLRKKKSMPDLILSSPAKRAKMTAESIAKKVHYNKKKIVYDQNIYEADVSTLEDILMDIDDKYNTVFLVGHNPGLNELAEHYAGYTENLPTCGIVSIAFTCKQWKDIDSDNAKLLFIDYPKK